MRWIGVSSLVLSLALFGCISVPGNHLGDLDPEPPSTAPAVEQTVGAFSFHLDGGKMVTSNKMGRILNDEILERWKEAGFITSHTYVKSSRFTGATNLRITLSGHQEGKSSIPLQILSGLTLTVIPYYVDTRLELRYTLENAETGCRFEAEVADSYNTVVGLLLLPASPFFSRGGRRTFDRVADHLYEQLAAKGAFEAHPPCVESPANLAPSSQDE